MQLQHSHTGFKLLKPITPTLKMDIVRSMTLVPLNTGWGYAIRDFVENIESKTDKDLEELLNELFADMQDGPFTMQQVLGSAFTFLQELVA